MFGQGDTKKSHRDSLQGAREFRFHGLCKCFGAWTSKSYADAGRYFSTGIFVFRDLVFFFFSRTIGFLYEPGFLHVVFHP